MSVILNYDVVVVGGGIAGISAAVKSAREGVKTLLVEHYSFVGGMSTAGMVSPFMKHSVNGESLVRGIFEDIENEMRSESGMIDNGFYANSFRSAAYKLLKNAGCDLMLNTEILSVSRNANKIEGIKVLRGSEELTVNAKIFIDTSGDAQLAFLADFPWVKGDEKTGLLQALTLFFRLGNIDIPKALDYVKSNKHDFFDWMTYDFDLDKIISVAGYFSHVKKAISDKKLSPEMQYIFYTTLPESGEASFNTSNILELDGSSSSDLTMAELKGREQVNQVVELLQKNIPGFENAYLLETAVQVGVRETRRVVGEYIFSGDDVLSGRKFNDPVARACYGIDIHGQKSESSKMDEIAEGEYYEIPLRALIVKDAENLLAAGRCISSTREGHAAIRIMPTSSATGEACGALASLAVKQSLNVRQIDYNDLEKLIKNNLTVKNV